MADRLNPDIIREHRERIRRGEIDIGPITKHEPTPENAWPDNRDPEAMGQMLIGLRAASPEPPFSVLADRLEAEDVQTMLPKYDGQGSTAELTSRQYRLDLEAAATEGDRAARFLLHLLDSGKSLHDAPQDPGGE